MALALLFGLFHGLVYVFLIPPWQHYDEPNHFEYAWLLAQRGSLPQPGDFDLGMERRVLESMVENDFFRGLPDPPDLSSPGVTPRLPGYSQLDEPPLYYVLASLPMRWLRIETVTTQLYAGRMISLALFLLSVLAAWGVARELFAPGNPLRWMAPTGLALLPSFVDVMTALNNDVAAVAIFSLFLWGSARLFRRRFSWIVCLWTAGMAVLCFFTKTTAYIALPLLPVVLLFALLRGRWRWLAWGLLAGGSVIGLSLVLTWGDASGWYRSTAQSVATRSSSSQAVVGGSVLVLDPAAEVTPGWLVPLFQPLPFRAGRELSGQGLTLGVWMWASRTVPARTPVLHQGGQAFSQAVMLSQEPAFFALQSPLAEGSARLWVSLDPQVSPEVPQAVIFYDGLVIAPGERPEDEAPQFDSPEGSRGFWGGQPFVNLLRNASAESAGPRFRPWFDDLGAKLLPDNTRPSLILTSLLDREGAGWMYTESTLRLLRTFWGRFGWGHVPLLGHKPYRFLGILTLIGLGGAFIGLWRRRRRLPWDVLLLMGLVLLGIWGTALVRGPIYLAVPHLYLPVARYAFPAIIPTLLIFLLGWQEGLRIVAIGVERALLRRSFFIRNRVSASTLVFENWLQSVVYLLFFVGLDLAAIVSIANFYGKA